MLSAGKIKYCVFPRVKENSGKRAILRGPLVYCVEEADNPSFDNLFISPDMVFIPRFNESLLKGVVTISEKTGDNNILFIPYCAWDNRDAGQMKVWVDYKE